MLACAIPHRNNIFYCTSELTHPVTLFQSSDSTWSRQHVIVTKTLSFNGQPNQNKLGPVARPLLSKSNQWALRRFSSYFLYRLTRNGLFVSLVYQLAGTHGHACLWDAKLSKSVENEETNELKQFIGVWSWSLWFVKVSGIKLLTDTWSSAKSD